MSDGFHSFRAHKTGKTTSHLHKSATELKIQTKATTGRSTKVMPSTRSRGVTRKQQRYRIDDSDEESSQNDVGGILVSISQNVPKASLKAMRSSPNKRNTTTPTSIAKVPSAVVVGSLPIFSPPTSLRKSGSRKIQREPNTPTFDDGVSAMTCDLYTPQKVVPLSRIPSEDSDATVPMEDTLNRQNNEDSDATMTIEESDIEGESEEEDSKGEVSEEEAEWSESESVESFESEEDEDEEDFIVDDDEYIPDEDDDEDFSDDEDLDDYVEPEKPKTRNTPRRKASEVLDADQPGPERLPTATEGQQDLVEHMQAMNLEASITSSHSTDDTKETEVIASSCLDDNFEGSPQPSASSSVLSKRSITSESSASIDSPSNEESDCDHTEVESSPMNHSPAEDLEDSPQQSASSSVLSERSKTTERKVSYDSPSVEEPDCDHTDVESTPMESRRLDFASPESVMAAVVVQDSDEDSDDDVLVATILNDEDEDHSAVPCEASISQTAHGDLECVDLPKKNTTNHNLSSLATTTVKVEASPQKTTVVQKNEPDDTKKETLADKKTDQAVLPKRKKGSFRREGVVPRGEWALGSKIGVGSFGVVHVGMNKRTGTLMAVKIFRMFIFFKNGCLVETLPVSLESSEAFHCQSFAATCLRRSVGLFTCMRTTLCIEISKDRISW